MKWFAFSVLAIALLVACEAPPPPAAKEPKPDLYFAKVDIRGVLVDEARQPAGGPMAICMPENKTDRPNAQNLPLDISGLKDWDGKKLHAVDGHSVHVTGTLQKQPFTIGDRRTERLVIVAKAMEEVVDKDTAPPPAGKESKPDAYFAKVDSRGVLVDVPHNPAGAPMIICIPLNQTDRPTGQCLPLDTSGLKDWDGKRLGAADGGTVHVTGTLQMQPFMFGNIQTERLVIVAKAMEEVVEKEDSPNQKRTGVLEDFSR